MRGLPPLADPQDIAVVYEECSNGRAILGNKNCRETQRYLTQVWKVELRRLSAAVAEHIEDGRCVYLKANQFGNLVKGLMQANVTLAEGLDVYVEMRLVGKSVVILAAHGHYTGL